jgi:hypothetical protein
MQTDVALTGNTDDIGKEDGRAPPIRSQRSGGENRVRGGEQPYRGSAKNSASGMNNSEAVLPIITIEATRSGSCLYFSAKM